MYYKLLEMFNLPDTYYKLLEMFNLPDTIESFKKISDEIFDEVLSRINSKGYIMCRFIGAEKVRTKITLRENGIKFNNLLDSIDLEQYDSKEKIVDALLEEIKNYNKINYQIININGLSRDRIIEKAILKFIKNPMLDVVYGYIFEPDLYWGSYYGFLYVKKENKIEEYSFHSEVKISKDIAKYCHSIDEYIEEFSSKCNNINYEDYYYYGMGY